MAFVEAMMQKYPPMPMISPDGVPLVASPWIASLAYVEGGKQIVDRMLRIQRKGERDAADPMATA